MIVVHLIQQCCSALVRVHLTDLQGHFFVRHWYAWTSSIVPRFSSVSVLCSFSLVVFLPSASSCSSTSSLPFLVRSAINGENVHRCLDVFVESIGKAMSQTMISGGDDCQISSHRSRTKRRNRATHFSRFAFSPDQDRQSFLRALALCIVSFVSGKDFLRLYLIKEVRGEKLSVFSRSSDKFLVRWEDSP